jgi:hypothetical protein
MVLEMTRRSFLVNVTASVAILTTVRLDQKLSADELRTLQSIARTIFPSRADERIYQEAVRQLDRRCRLDGELFYVVTRGVAAIEWTYGGQFSSQPQKIRVRVLKEIEKTRFFMVVYSAFLESFFGPHESWTLFLGKAASDAV